MQERPDEKFYERRDQNRRVNNVLFLRFIGDLKFQSVELPRQLERVKADLLADIRQGIPLNVIVGRSTSFFALDNINYPRYTTPLIIAVQRNSPGLVEFLIKNGADPNFGLDSSDTYVQEDNLFNVNEINAAKYPTNYNSVGALTPLDFAVYFQLPLVARTLIENGADRLTLNVNDTTLTEEQKDLVYQINDYIAYLKYRPGSQEYNEALYRFSDDNVRNPRNRLRKLPRINQYTPGKAFKDFVQF